MTKYKSNKLITLLIRIYFSIVCFLIVFFTIFAFRYDVVDILIKNKALDFRLSEKTKEEVSDFMESVSLNNENIDKINQNLSRIAPDYGFSIYEVEYKKSGEGEVKFALTSGKAQYEIVWNNSDAVTVKVDGKLVDVIFYPTYREYTFIYMAVDTVVSLLVVLFGCWLIHLEKKHKRLMKLAKRVQAKLPDKFLHQLSWNLLLINVVAGSIAFGAFFYMYLNRFAFFDFTREIVDIQEYERITERNKPFLKLMKNLSLNKENQEEILALMNDAQTSTSMAYMYNTKNLFYVGSSTERREIEKMLTRKSIYNVRSLFTPNVYFYTMETKSGFGSYMVYSYPTFYFATPYTVVIVLIALSFYLIALMRFINRKVFAIKAIQDDILILANGDLSHEVESTGYDEIAQLAMNLNRMRIMLNENIQNEEQSRKNNSELITSMSHDLRTPLTSIKAYLDILKYRKYKDDEQYEKCLDRCIKKVEDIKEMSDAMFEYSLVFEPEHQAQLVDTTLEEVLPYLIDQMEQIEMNHFDVNYRSAQGTCRLKMDTQLLKRVFNNIFSNILKYADDTQPVKVQVDLQATQLVMTFQNGVRHDIDKVERNHIGLKSTAKMMNLMQGNLNIEKTEDDFICVLTFAITKTQSK